MWFCWSYLKYFLLFHTFFSFLITVSTLSCFILHSISQLMLLLLVDSSRPKERHTSAVFSVLISIFPSKGPHVVPTGSCCRLWIRRSPSLRNASSSPKTQQSPKKSAIVLYIAHKFHIKSQWHSFIVLSPQTCMRIKAPQWAVKVKAKQFQNG